MSKFSPLRIDLESRPDRNQQPIYLGKIEAPITLNFKKGTAFFIFNSEPGCEEIKISKATPGSACSPIRKSFKGDGSLDRYHIILEKKMDTDGCTYYMALVQDDTIELDFSDGFLFFVFTSKSGAEQIQIVKNNLSFEKSDTEIEVLRYSRKESGVQEAVTMRKEKLASSS